MDRQNFISLLSLLSISLATNTFFCGERKSRRILLRSSWQTINIGDIGHTPGMLNLLEKFLPQVKVTLWPSSVANGVEEMILKRFPDLNIIMGNTDIKKAFAECDFLLHGSGPFLVGIDEVKKWVAETGKPYGIYGVTFSEGRPEEIDVINGAKFAYFRDSVSLRLAREKGANCAIMEFCPDAAFAVDVRNDQSALRFLKETGLEESKYLCCVPRYRYTQNWLIPIKNRPLNPTKHARNEEMKEHDHEPLRQAIIEIVRHTDMKVLICPEDVTQMQVGKDMLYDRLPEAVKSKVVWRSTYWLTDEAVSTFVRSVGLFGNEMHSPIMCIGNGIPAIVCRFKEQTSKGYMWRDIGLGHWLFDLDSQEDVKKIVATVLSLVTDREGSQQKVLAAQKCIQRHQRDNMEQLARIIDA